jgi:hypothetical protein
VQGILADAAAAVEKVLPLPEIEEMRNLIDATITGTLDILQVCLHIHGGWSLLLGCYLVVHKKLQTLCSASAEGITEQHCGLQGAHVLLDALL